MTAGHPCADTSAGLVILDVSEIQARKPNPSVEKVSRLTWDEISIPQVAIPVTIDGAPYLVEIDGFSAGASTAAGASVGAARIIDIADERNPTVVSDIRLEVNNAAGRAASIADPGTSTPIQGYTGHYCSVPQEVEPGIVACSFIASGLRVFDIRDPLEPEEIAYWNQPVVNSFLEPFAEPSSYAMSAPAFVPERAEIWYSDGNSGFWALRFTDDVWPFSDEEGVGAGAGEDPTSVDGVDDTASEDGSSTPPAEGPPAVQPSTQLPATGGSATTTLVGAVLLGAVVLWRRADGVAGEQGR